MVGCCTPVSNIFFRMHRKNRKGFLPLKIVLGKLKIICRVREGYGQTAQNEKNKKHGYFNNNGREAPWILSLQLLLIFFSNKVL